MNIKRVLALIFTAVLLLSTAACTTVTVKVPAEFLTALQNSIAANNNAAPQAPADNTPIVNNTTVPANDATQAPEVPTAAPSSPEAPTAAPSSPEAPTAAPSSPEAPTAAPAAPEAPTSAPAASSAPSTKEEIINYYVTAYNKIGTDSSSVTRTYDYTSNYKNILKIGDSSALKSIASSLMGQFMVETKEATPSSFNDLPPVGITNLSIAPNLVSEAICTDKGDHYEVTLKSTGTDENYEVDSVPGVGSAGVIGPLLRTEDVTGAASMIKFEGLHSWYATAFVVAKIDKASGHITELAFETPCVLHFDKVSVAIVSVENCDIGLLFQQNYSVAY